MRLTALLFKVCIVSWVIVSQPALCPVYGSDAKIGKPQLSKNDIMFGEAQLRRMIQDRPAMAEFITPDSPIWNWAARQFAGGFAGVRYYWVDDTPYKAPHRFLAAHGFPISTTSGWITVVDVDNDGYCFDGEQMWAALILELLNLRNDQRFKEIWLRALEGKLSKEQFNEQNFRVEYLARAKLAKFYLEFVKPVATSMGKQSHDHFWLTQFPDSYESWLANGRRPSLDLSPFDFDYEHEIAPRLKH